MRKKSHEGVLPAAISATSGRLSRRESELMEVVYRLGRASAAEIRHALTDPPGDSSVRKQLDLLEQKGLLRHTVEGRRFIYEPRIPAGQARRTALGSLVDRLFRGDYREAMVALLSMADETPDADELDALLEAARKARRASR